MSARHSATGLKASHKGRPRLSRCASAVPPKRLKSGSSRMASRLSMSNVSSKPAALAELSSCLSLVVYSETKLAHRLPSAVIAADASVARGWMRVCEWSPGASREGGEGEGGGAEHPSQPAIAPAPGRALRL